jgi:hypothetical protein
MDVGIDAGATLAEAYVQAAGSLSSGTLIAGEFLLMYTGRDAEIVELVERCWNTKIRQNPFTLGAIRKGIESYSLSKFFGKINLNLGGK